MKLDPENITELYVPVLPCDYSKGLVLKLYDDAGEYVRVLMFKDGKLLQPQTVTGFNVLYDAGFMLDLTPEDGFGGGSAAGVRIDPVAFLVIKDGTTRVLPVAVPPVSSVERIVDMVPDVLDRVEKFIDKKRNPGDTEII